MVERPQPPAIASEVLSAIEAMGFSTDNFYETDEAFWVEGDIVDTTANIGDIVQFGIGSVNVITDIYEWEVNGQIILEQTRNRLKVHMVAGGLMVGCRRLRDGLISKWSDFVTVTQS